MSDTSILSTRLAALVQRRTFLRLSGASAASAALVLAGCSTDTPTPTTVDATIFAVRSGTQSTDIGFLNYLYVLAQITSAVYQKVVDAPPADFTTSDKDFFSDIRDHEVVHRELLKYALGTTNALPIFPLVLTSLTLTTRTGVLAAARQLEDLAAAAYPSVIPLMTDATYRDLLLKMSTVYARHSTLVRDLTGGITFSANDAEVVQASGVGAGQAVLKTPTEVVAATAAFLLPYSLYIDNLPTA
jgi:hypothetical protein